MNTKREPSGFDPRDDRIEHLAPNGEVLYVEHERVRELPAESMPSWLGDVRGVVCWVAGFGFGLSLSPLVGAWLRSAP